MTCWDYSVSKVFGFQPKVTKYMVWYMIEIEGRLGMRRCALGPLLIHCQEHIVNQALLLHFSNHLYPYRYTWHFCFPVKNIYSHPGVPSTDSKLHFWYPFKNNINHPAVPGTVQCSPTVSPLSRTITQMIGTVHHLKFPVKNIICHPNVSGTVPSLLVPY